MRVVAGVAKGAVADYDIAVADDSTVVPVDEVSATSGDAGGQQTLTLAPGAPVPAVGRVLAVGVGPETPAGLLGQVAAVNGQTVTLEGASLYDVLPQGSFEKEIVLTSEDANRRGAFRAGVPGLVRDLAEEVDARGIPP